MSGRDILKTDGDMAIQNLRGGNFEGGKFLIFSGTGYTELMCPNPDVLRPILAALRSSENLTLRPLKGVLSTKMRHLSVYGADD